MVTNTVVVVTDWDEDDVESLLSASLDDEKGENVVQITSLKALANVVVVVLFICWIGFATTTTTTARLALVMNCTLFLCWVQIYEW